MDGFEIRSWSVPDRRTLRLWVGSLDLPLGEAFFRVLDRSSGMGPDGSWVWRQMSCAEKPTVPVRPEAACALLDRLVLEHGELGVMAPLFGIVASFEPAGLMPGGVVGFLAAARAGEVRRADGPRPAAPVGGEAAGPGRVMDLAAGADRRALFAGLQAALVAMADLHYSGLTGVTYEEALGRVEKALVVGAPYGSPEHLASLRG